MTKNYYLLVLVLLASIVITSCSGSGTYAEELKTEQSLIKNYIKREDINVLSKMPTTWGPKDYVLTSSGLYFHLDSVGEKITGDTLEAGNVVIPHYIQYTLGEPADTIRKWTSVDFATPQSFVYGDATGTYSCTAFQEAVSYMKRSESYAKIIVPSRIGFDYNWTPATPIGYIIKIRIRK